MNFPNVFVPQALTVAHMRIQVRVDDEIAEQLEREAEEMGFDSLSPYLRWIIRNRDGSLLDRVDDLEERLIAVEQRLE